jgi:hypothetical protein
MSRFFLQMLGVVLAALTLAVGPMSVANAAPPTIWQQWVSDVTSSDATLHAEINPGGLQTSYKLQLDTTGNFNFYQSNSCLLYIPGMFCLEVIVPGDPLPEGLVQPPEFSLPASSDNQHVSVSMSSIGATLQPETTYHYRAVAGNTDGIVYGAYPYYSGNGWEYWGYGAEVTFTTPAADPEPPAEEPPTEEPPEEEPPVEEPPAEEPPAEEPPEEEPPTEEEPPSEEPPGGGEPPGGIPPWGGAASPVLPPEAAPRARHRSKRAARRRAMRKCVRRARRRARHRGNRMNARSARRRCARHRNSKRARIALRVPAGP